MTRDEFEAHCAAMDAELLLLAEWRAIERKLEACYRAVADGTATVITRSRMQRLEALQKALCGYPGALAD